MISLLKRRASAVCCIAALLMSSVRAEACTSAIVSGDRTPDGRPLLWKHRDTSTIDNKVEFVKGKRGEYDYVGLFNAADRRLAEVWGGMNSVGFAIINTASYNIKDDDVPQSGMDKEGYLMTIALKSCRTVEDFAGLLERLPRPMGVEANFGVIDADGAGAYFETNNTEFVRFDLKDAPDGVLVRTNYSHSGSCDRGYGFIREANACHLLEPYVASRSVTAEVLTEVVSRSFYHSLYERDFVADPKEGKDGRWVIDQDFIPRYKSTATIVIEGCEVSPDGSGDVSQYIMWTGLGYPPVSEIYKVTCSETGVPDELRGLLEGGHSAASDKAREMRDMVFPFSKGNRDKYIDLQVLTNAAGTGLMDRVKAINREVYARERELRDYQKREVAASEDE